MTAAQPEELPHSARLDALLGQFCGALRKLLPRQSTVDSHFELVLGVWRASGDDFLYRARSASASKPSMVLTSIVYGDHCESNATTQRSGTDHAEGIHVGLLVPHDR